MPAVAAGTVAVTGANGFIGSYMCAALLEKGYTVRAVVRNSSDQTKVAHLLALPGAAKRLTCVSGQLLEAGGYDDAFAGCAAVVHTAAVVEILDNSDAENKIVRPAVEGTKNVLASCRKAGIQRLVMTSSVAAVQAPLGKPDDHLYTEADWNEWSTITSDAYGYAKVQQEKALWASLEAEPAPFDAAVLCPSVVLGPPLTKQHTKSSTVFVREVLFGNSLNNFNTSFVDVRDVAAAAAAALARPEAGGTRTIVTGDEGPMNTLEIGPICQKSFPQYRVGGTARYGGWTMWAGSLVGLVPQFAHAQFTRTYTFSNARLKSALGVAPRPLAKTVRDSAQAMIDGGWVKPRPA